MSMIAPIAKSDVIMIVIENQFWENIVQVLLYSSYSTSIIIERASSFSLILAGRHWSSIGGHF